MGLFKNYVSQTRKPEGFLGKMMLGGMNSGHAKLADWGFTHLPAMTPESAWSATIFVESENAPKV